MSLGLYRVEIFIDGRQHCLFHAPAPDLRPAAKRFGGGIVETEGDNRSAGRANVRISHANRLGTASRPSVNRDACSRVTRYQHAVGQPHPVP
jgi:hypothetical protein